MRKYILPAAIVIFTALRIPSLIEPLWYSDENIYFVVAHALSRGSVLYRDIWDNKPPILYLLYLLAHGELFYIKLLSLVFGIAAIICFYLFTTRIFSLKQGGVITVLFAVLFGLPLLEGNIANAENFMLAPIALAFYLILVAQKKRWFVAGLLFSFVVMTKIVGVFDLAAVFMILYLQSSYSDKISISNTWSFITQRKLRKFYLGLISLPLVFVIYFTLNHALLPFLHGVLSTNIGYVAYENTLFVPFGRLLLKTVGLLIALLLILLYRKKLVAQEKIMYPWIVFSMYSVFFADRPYTHYILMGLMPFLVLLVGLVQSRVKVLSILVSVIIFILVYVSFPLYTRTIPYYQNYISYVFSDKKPTDYLAFFDSGLPQKYELAAFLQPRIAGEHDIFYWSDSATLYVLTNTLPAAKYIVAYHILFYNNAIPETRDALMHNQPKFIISDKNDPTVLADFLNGYHYIYSIGSARIYEK